MSISNEEMQAELEKVKEEMDSVILHLENTKESNEQFQRIGKERDKYKRKAEQYAAELRAAKEQMAKDRARLEQMEADEKKTRLRLSAPRSLTPGSAKTGAKKAPLKPSIDMKDIESKLSKIQSLIR